MWLREGDWDGEGAVTIIFHKFNFKFIPIWYCSVEFNLFKI